MSEELETRKIIVHKYLKNINFSRRLIAKSLNLPQSTVNRTIKRFQHSQSIKKNKDLVVLALQLAKKC
jgi:IS30 family transposase